MERIAFEVWYSQRNPFSVEERTECIKTIDILEDIAYEVEFHGLLSLEDEVMSYNHYLIRKAIYLVVDGTTIEELYDVLTDYVVSSNYRGKDLLEAMIIIKGFVFILEKNSSEKVKERCLALVGNVSI